MTPALIFLAGLAVTGLLGFTTWVKALKLANPGTLTAVPIVRAGFPVALWIAVFYCIVRFNILDTITSHVHGIFG